MGTKYPWFEALCGAPCLAFEARRWTQRCGDVLCRLCRKGELQTHPPLDARRSIRMPACSVFCILQGVEGFQVPCGETAEGECDVDCDEWDVEVPFWVCEAQKHGYNGDALYELGACVPMPCFAMHLASRSPRGPPP